MNHTAKEQKLIPDVKELALSVLLGSICAVAAYNAYKLLKKRSMLAEKAEMKPSDANVISHPKCIGETFKIELEGTDAQGLEFSVGDKFKVLALEENSIRLDKLGDANNPYLVDADFLLGISTLSADLLK